MIQPVGVPAFDALALAAERVLQGSKPFATQAAATTATKIYLQSVISAAAANNVAVPNLVSALSAINATGNP
jgi:hypothetical protein